MQCGSVTLMYATVATLNCFIESSNLIVYEDASTLSDFIAFLQIIHTQHIINYLQCI